MSANRAAVFLAAQHGPASNGSLAGGARAGAVGGSLHGGVNVLLGGAMLSGVILVVFLICYCCHRNMRKGEPGSGPGRSHEYWQQDGELPLGVFTVDPQCLSATGSCGSLDSLAPPPSPGPPPAYEAVVRLPDSKAPCTCGLLHPPQPAWQDSSGLPTYEAALRLEAQGYV